MLEKFAMRPNRNAEDLPALSELDPAGLNAWVASEGLPAYRGRQLWAGVAQRGIQSFLDLTEFPLGLRQRLAAAREIRTLQARVHLTSPGDATEKVLFQLDSGATVETVLIPTRTLGGATRYTVCVSSQVGCPAGCTFCATGLSGFAGNLSAAQIVDQVMYFVHRLRTSGDRVSNIVFMGMGEPFLNAAAVRSAIQRLTHPDSLGLGQRRITVSTVGIVPQIDTFSSWAGQVNLAISLHAPNDELRSSLVPYNRHFPIADLMEAVGRYVKQTNRRVSFEYVLLRNVNDSSQLARELGRLLSPFGGMAHVNLIPWNPFQEGEFVRSLPPDAEAFAQTLDHAGVNATIRHSKGLDISAACGQLREQARAGT